MEMAGGSLWSSKGRKRPLVYHECVFCGKIYTEYRDLECHINGHTGEKPFECKDCGEIFANRHYFYNHSRICKPVPKKKHKSDRKRERRKESVKIRKVDKVEVMKQYERKDQAKGKNQKSGFHEVSLYPLNNRLKLINQNSHQAAALSASFFLHMGRYDPDEIYPRLPNEIGNVVQLPPPCIAKPVLKENSISIISPSLEFMDLVSEDESQYLNVVAPDPVPNTERDLSPVVLSTKDVLDVEEQAPGYTSAPIPMTISEPYVEPLIESQPEDSIDEPQTQAISIPVSEVVPKSRIEQFVNESDRLTCMSEDGDECNTQRIDDLQTEMIGLISSGLDVFCTDKIIDKPVFKEKSISSNPPSTEVADIVSEDESDVYVPSFDEVPNIEPDSGHAAVSAKDVLDMEVKVPGDTTGPTPMFISGPNVEPLIESQPEDSIDEPQSQPISIPVSKVLLNEEQECNAHEFIGEPMSVHVDEIRTEESMDEPLTQTISVPILIEPESRTEQLDNQSEEEDECNTQRLDAPLMIRPISAVVDVFSTETIIDEPLFTKNSVSNISPSTEVIDLVSEDESDVDVTAPDPGLKQAAASATNVLDMDGKAPGDTTSLTSMCIVEPNMEPLIESQTERSIDVPQTQAISIPVSEVGPCSRTEQLLNESDRLTSMSEDEDECITKRVDDTQTEMIRPISAGVDVFSTEQIIDEPNREKKIRLMSQKEQDYKGEELTEDPHTSAMIIPLSEDTLELTTEQFVEDLNIDTRFRQISNEEQEQECSTQEIIDESQTIIMSEIMSAQVDEIRTEDSIDEPQTQAISIPANPAGPVSVPNKVPDKRQFVVSVKDVIIMEVDPKKLIPISKLVPESSTEQFTNESEDEHECNTQRIDDPQMEMIRPRSAGADVFSTEQIIDEPVYSETSIPIISPSTEVIDLVSEDESDVYVTARDPVPNTEADLSQVAVLAKDVLDVEEKDPGDATVPTPMFIPEPDMEPLIESPTEGSIDEPQTQAISIPVSEVAPDSRTEQLVDDSDSLTNMSEDEHECNTQRIDDSETEMIRPILAGANVCSTEQIVDEPIREKRIRFMSQEEQDCSDEELIEDPHLAAMIIPLSEETHTEQFVEGLDLEARFRAVSNEEQECNAQELIGEPLKTTMSELMSAQVDEIRTEDSMDEPQTQAISLPIFKMAHESRTEQLVNESEDEDECNTQRIDGPQAGMITPLSAGVDVFSTETIIDEPVFKENSVSNISPSTEVIDLVSEDESDVNVTAPDPVPNIETGSRQATVLTMDVIYLVKNAPGNTTTPTPMFMSEPNMETLIESQAEDSIDEPQTPAISIPASEVVPEPTTEQFGDYSDRLTNVSEDEHEWSTQRIDDPQTESISVQVDEIRLEDPIDEPQTQAISVPVPKAVLESRTEQFVNESEDEHECNTQHIDDLTSTEVIDLAWENKSDVNATAPDPVPNIEPDLSQAAVSAKVALDLLEEKVPGDTTAPTLMFISEPIVEHLIEFQTEHPDPIDEPQTQTISIPVSEVGPCSRTEQLLNESDRPTSMSEDEDECITKRIDDPQTEMIRPLSAGVDVFSIEQIIDEPNRKKRIRLMSQKEQGCSREELIEDPHTRAMIIPLSEETHKLTTEQFVEDVDLEARSRRISNEEQEQECNAQELIGEPQTITMSELTSAQVDEMKEDSIDEPQTQSISIPVNAAIPVSAPNMEPGTGQLVVTVKDVIIMKVDPKKRTITPLPVAKANYYQCRFCKKDFKHDRATLAQHIVRNHSERRGKRTIICAFCKTTSKKFLAAEKHLRLNHHDLLLKIDAISVNSVPIDIKSGVVQSPKSVNVVQGKNSPPVLTIGANDPFRDEDDACHDMPILEPQVPQNVRDNPTLPRSTETNTSVLPRCETCGKVFTSKKNLLRHKNQLTKCERNSNLNLPLTCPVCNLQFSNKGNLLQHIVYGHRQTLPNNKVKCGLCSQISSSVKNLLGHTKSKHHSFLRAPGGTTNTRIQ